jgi:diguanylate cyclase (GGDEF)-like protein/PAS domain S-box-containing protein
MAPTREELLQFLYLTPVGVVKFSRDGTVDLINAAASALLLALKPGDTLRDIFAALAPLVPNLRQLVQRFTGAAGTVFDAPMLESPAGAEMMTLALTVNRINDAVFMAVLRDVTRLAEQERKLYADRQKFFAIFDHVRDYAIYTITPDGVVEEWNHSLERYGGWQPEDVVGRSMGLFFPADDADRPDVSALLAEALRVGSVETEGWRRRRDGSRLWANSVITALPDEDGMVRGFVVISRDITGRKRMEDDMKLLATVDPLTGAYNRRQGDALLDAEFSRRARDGRPFAVMLLDIDHFKAVNDSAGHAAGDAVLVSLVQTCHAVLRSIDMVVRWGGEEFLLVLPDTDAAAAMAAAERLRAALAEAEVAGVRFTVSIGVAVPAADTPAELLRRADVALYIAKATGRDRVSLAA